MTIADYHQSTRRDEAEFFDDGVPDTSEMVSEHERNVRELVRVGLRRARGEA